MFNILVVAHGDLAESLVKVTKGITGSNKGNLLACGFNMAEDADVYIDRLKNIVENLRDKKPLLILSDLFGGTPCNVLMSKIDFADSNIKIITGINLPMLLEAFVYSDFMEIDNVVEKLHSSPARTIIDITPRRNGELSNNHI